VVDGERKECPLDPYVIAHERCQFVDQQTIKLQEAPDAVPVGELPRHIIISADRCVWSVVADPRRPRLIMSVMIKISDRESRTRFTSDRYGNLFDIFLV
jgi:DNA replication licensing factor MCM5